MNDQILAAMIREQGLEELVADMHADGLALATGIILSALARPKSTPLIPMSLRAFGSPDSLANYCIKKAHRDGVSEWKVVYDVLYASHDAAERDSQEKK